MKKTLIFIFTIIPIIPMINAFIFFRERITGKRNTICNEDILSGHKWIYWNANLICKSTPRINGTLPSHVRKCSECEVQQTWHRWAGLGGEGLWQRSHHDLSYDKTDVDIEIFTMEDLAQQKRKRDIENIKSEKREKQLDKLLNKKQNGNKNKRRYKKS